MLLAAALVLTGCPDDAGDDNDDGNGDNNGTPTEATKVQSAASGVISANAITLNWTLPTDIVGFLGTTITERDNSGSLSEPVELGDSATEYQVTNLAPATAYTFTIATRYTDSGKNNSTTITAMTAAATQVQRVMLVAGETTSNSVTIAWEDPEDTNGYTGVSISTAATVGDLTIDTPRTIPKNTNTLTISGLAAETEHMFMLTFATQYDTQGKSGSSDHTIAGTTQSNRVTSVAVSAITRSTITLSWTEPEDTIQYSGVTISAAPDITVMEDTPATTATITGLTAGTTYMFTITTRYQGSKAGAGAETPITVSSLPAIDADDDTLIDIISLERLNNIRYNLDLMDGRYKTSADDAGVQCGTAEDTPCIGYELTRNLDFTNAGSYDSGVVNTIWRPNTSDPATATNAGWEPIGSCNADVNMTTFICGDGDDTPFATRFIGNGYTISNLYARNTNNSTGTAIGLFGIVNNSATITTVGVVDAVVYGSNANADRVGGLVGFNSGGTITASYASGSTADGGMGGDIVGGLVGSNSISTITASYATGSTVDGGIGNDSVGGLVGSNNNSTIAASYASGSTADGGADNDNVGGLVGSNNDIIRASYVTGSTVDGGADNDDVGGLVGRNGHNSTIAASYVSGSTADGGADNDRVGGLVGSNLNNGTIRASYAAATADGGTGNGDRVGSLVGVNSETSTGIDPPITLTGTITASYGFGTTNNVDTAGDSGSSRPNGVTTAAHLTAAAVPAAWNQASSRTASAWHFGTTSQIPALRYADYDGSASDNTYGCGSSSTATIVIPSTVPNGTGGTLTVTCGTTLLPGQR